MGFGKGALVKKMLQYDWYTGLWWVGRYDWYSDEGPIKCLRVWASRCTKRNTPATSKVLVYQSSYYSIIIVIIITCRLLM